METRIPLRHICLRCGHSESDPPELGIGDGVYRYAVDFKRISGEGLDHWGWIGKAGGLGAAFNDALDALIDAMPQEATCYQVSRILNLSLPLSEST